MSTAIPAPTRLAAGSRRARICACATYVEAEHVVEVLERRRFPTEYVSIVAVGVRRDDRPQAPWRAAAVGTLLGAFAGAVGGILAALAGATGELPSLAVALFTAVLGAFSALTATLVIAKSETSDSPQLTADTYEVLVDADWGADARLVLGAGCKEE